MSDHPACLFCEHARDAHEDGLGACGVLGCQCIGYDDGYSDDAGEDDEEVDELDFEDEEEFLLDDEDETEFPDR